MMAFSGPTLMSSQNEIELWSLSDTIHLKKAYSLEVQGSGQTTREDSQESFPFPLFVLFVVDRSRQNPC